jgi:hypothetical protein
MGSAVTPSHRGLWGSAVTPSHRGLWGSAVTPSGGGKVGTQKKRGDRLMSVVLIVCFEIIELCKEANARTRIRGVLGKWGKTGDNFEEVYKNLQQKYVIWSREKKKYSAAIKKKLRIRKVSMQKGGFIERLELKKDKPITGEDITKMMDDMQQFFYNAKYTEEGQWLKEPDTLLSLLRGDTTAFKYYINYAVLPKYYSIFPPFLKWDAIKKAIENRKYEDYPDYLLAYMHYWKVRNETNEEFGLPPVSTAYDESSPLAQFAAASDKLMTSVAQTRRKILQPKSMNLIMGMPGGAYIG